MSDVKAIRFFVEKSVLDIGVKIVFPIIPILYLKDFTFCTTIRE